MGDRTSIEWTATHNPDGTVTPGATWNPITGCSKVSPGCAYCYAERLEVGFGRSLGPWNQANAIVNVKIWPERLEIPLRWKKPRRIFVCSMSDLFHEIIPSRFLEDVVNVMRQAYWHQFLVLTKRPERFYRFDPPIPNIWYGVSAENQQCFDERTRILIDTPAAIKFVSIEPILGPVDTSAALGGEDGTGRGGYGVLPAIDWVIVGGESGGPPERSLVHLQSATVVGEAQATIRYWLEIKIEALKWVRSIRDQCLAAGVPFFFKQWGGHSAKSGGRLLDGRTWDDYPKVSA